MEEDDDGEENYDGDYTDSLDKLINKTISSKISPFNKGRQGEGTKDNNKNILNNKENIGNRNSNGLQKCKRVSNKNIGGEADSDEIDELQSSNNKNEIHNNDSCFFAFGK